MSGVVYAAFVRMLLNSHTRVALPELKRRVFWSKGLQECLILTPETTTSITST